MRKIQGTRSPGVQDSGEVRSNPSKNIICQAHKDRIDISVCIVRSMRQPEKCNGCPINY